MQQASMIHYQEEPVRESAFVTYSSFSSQSSAGKRNLLAKSPSNCFCLFAIVFVVYGLTIAQNVVQADVFTAVVELEHLLDAELSLAEELRKYVDNESRRLERLLRLANEWERHGLDGRRAPDRHLENPIYVFQLIKRLTADWQTVVEDDIRSSYSQEFLTSLLPLLNKFPSDEDLDGAADAILRLQDTYALTTDQIANGGIDGSPNMTADDCYLLGIVSYVEDDYYTTTQWMYQALQIHDQENVKTISRARLLEVAQDSLRELEHIELALKLTNEWLQIEPDNMGAILKRVYYTDTLLQDVVPQGTYETTEGNVRDTTDTALAADSDITDGFGHNNAVFNTVGLEPAYDIDAVFNRLPNNGTYERLCRGEQTQDRAHQLTDRLTCRYLRHHPMFYIRPIKEELVYDNPRIAIYHDVLSEPETIEIRQLARPKLSRSKVVGSDGSEISDVRISKSAWLKDEESLTIQRFSERSEAITGLSHQTAEDMQVLNYGIGGYFKPHLDAFSDYNLKSMAEPNNRIATFLCYITNVAAGGATVFPEIGVTLWPKLVRGAFHFLQLLLRTTLLPHHPAISFSSSPMDRHNLPPVRGGSCAFWYNLRLNGERDYRSLHAACPVLSGSKWVCNKWFRERGQEFRRRCSTDASD